MPLQSFKKQSPRVGCSFPLPWGWQLRSLKLAFAMDKVLAHDRIGLVLLRFRPIPASLLARPPLHFMIATAKLPQSSRTATAFSMQNMSGTCLGNAAFRSEALLDLLLHSFATPRNLADCWEYNVGLGNAETQNPVCKRQWGRTHHD